ncbi:MAG: MFS transporter [Alphaproteobacteria bacterium]|nr:MFS transporter [Alphaproteobacteria bacterium]
MSSSAVPAAPGRAAFRTSLAGLLMALALASLDQNIVSTALPRIVGELGGLAHLSWVVTAFMLTSTATAPLYGKLSDTYGRRPMFVIAIVTFVAGSALCGLAGSLDGLIVFRGLQGLGAGGLMVLAQTTIGDLVSPRERGRYQGLFTGVFALCSVLGPLLGGVITDALSWRWIFYVNLPVGAVALVLIVTGLTTRSGPAPAGRIDYAGAGLLTAATTCLLLVLSWGGAIYPWVSAPVLGLAASATMLSIVLVLRERVAPEAVLPMPLFRNRVFAVAVAVTAITATALFGAFVFLPTYFQLVMGESPSRAGLLTAPLMAGLIAASIVGGRVVSALGRYKPLALVGFSLATAGFFAMAWGVAAGSGLVFIEAVLIVMGAGLGLVMPNLTVAIQNAVPRAELGAATSAASFFRSLGGALGVAVSGAMLSARIESFLAASGSPLAVRHAATTAFAEIAQLPPEARAAIVEAYRQAIGATFLTGAGIAALGLGALFLLPELPLRDARS